MTAGPATAAAAGGIGENVCSKQFLDSRTLTRMLLHSCVCESARHFSPFHHLPRLVSLFFSLVFGRMIVIGAHCWFVCVCLSVGKVSLCECREMQVSRCSTSSHSSDAITSPYFQVRRSVLVTVVRWICIKRGMKYSEHLSPARSSTPMCITDAREQWIVEMTRVSALLWI